MRKKKTVQERSRILRYPRQRGVLRLRFENDTFEGPFLLLAFSRGALTHYSVHFPELIGNENGVVTVAITTGLASVPPRARFARFETICRHYIALVISNFQKIC